MRQRVSAPDAEALCGFFAERALGVYLGGIGADEGDGEVEHRPALDDETDAAENAVDLPIPAETVAVNQRKPDCLFDQFLVGHCRNPHHCTNSERAKCVRYPTFVKSQCDLYPPWKYALRSCSVTELAAMHAGVPA